MRNKRGLGQRINVSKRDHYAGNLTIVDPGYDLLMMGVEGLAAAVVIAAKGLGSLLVVDPYNEDLLTMGIEDLAVSFTV